MATRNLGSLTIDLIAKTGGFERGMDRAARTADRRMKDMQRQAKIAGAAIGTAITGVGVALAAAVRRTVGEMAQVARMADQIGVATEHLTSMRYAAEQLAGVSSGQFDMALRRMTRRITEAADGGGPAAKAIEAMGLSARELAKLSPDEQFRKIADAIKATGDQGTRLRHVMALMDTEGMPLVTMLAEGADGIREYEEAAEQLGLTFSNKTGKQALEFEQTMKRVNASIRGIVQQVSIDLLPKLNEFAELLNSSQFREGFQTIVNGAVTAATKLADLAVTTANVTKFLAEEVASRVHGTLATDTVRVEQRIERLEQTMQGLDALERKGPLLTWFDADFLKASEFKPSDFLKPIAEVRERLQGELDKERNKLKLGIELNEAAALSGRVSDLLSHTAVPSFELGTDSGASSGDASKRLRELLQEQQRLMDAQRGWRDQLLDAQAALEGPVAEANRQHQKQMADLARAYDEGEIKLSDYVQMQEVYEEQLDRSLEAIEAQRTPFQRMLEDLAFEHELLGMTNEEREVAISQRWAHVSAISAEGEQLAEAVRGLRQAREATGDLIAAQDAVRGAGADFLTDWTTGASSFKDAMMDALESIHRRITQMISERLMDQLFGQSGQDGGGAAGGWLSSLFGSMFVGGRAHGGPVPPFSIAQINERGHEAPVQGFALMGEIAA